MEDNKIRVGITQGDINGVGYEVILKTFADPVMLELCTPIIYGSPKVAAYHRKSLDLPTNFSIVNSASEAVPNRLSVVNCTDDEVKVEFSKPDVEAGKAALGALEKAIEEYKEGMRRDCHSSHQQAYHPVGGVCLPRTYGVYRAKIGRWREGPYDSDER